jgi:acyl carrier protein
VNSVASDLSDFGERLCRALGVPAPGEWHGELGLFDELGLDSLGAFQLLVTLEDLAGIAFPPDDPPPLFTLGDAHRYYCELAARARS